MQIFLFIEALRHLSENCLDTVMDKTAKGLDKTFPRYTVDEKNDLVIVE